MKNQGMKIQRMKNQGMNNQGMKNQGMNNQGMNNQGMKNQGMNNQGMKNQGMKIQGNGNWSGNPFHPEIHVNFDLNYFTFHLQTYLLKLLYLVQPIPHQFAYLSMLVPSISGGLKDFMDFSWKN